MVLILQGERWELPLLIRPSACLRNSGIHLTRDIL
jgi:hypothetical protein